MKTFAGVLPVLGRLPVLVLVSLSLLRPVHAECNSPTKWSEFPSLDAKALVGFTQEQPFGFGQTSVSSSSEDNPYPNYLDDAEIAKYSNGKLSKTETSYISYYERDNRGRWRICRVEMWWPPGAGSEDSRIYMLKTTEKYLSSNPQLRKALSGHVVLYATQYFYDKKGRIAKTAVGDFMNVINAADVKICREYDEKDRLVLYMNPHTTQSCSNEPPDVRDEWLRNRYGDYRGEQVVLLDEWHHGSAGGRWSKKFEVFRTSAGPDNVRGAALAKWVKGVTTIYGSNAGKLDDNPANTVLNSFGQTTGSTYYFTKPPVPLEVLEHPELIYRYERRRQTYIDGEHFRLYELFRPNEHISHHRYYYQGGMLSSTLSICEPWTEGTQARMSSH
jgi:hypothetical protein